MKRNNLNKEKGLKKAVNDVKKKNSKKKVESSESEESQSEESVESEEEKPKSKKNVKFAKKIEVHKSDSESDNNSDNDSDNKSSKSNKSTKSTKSNKSTIEQKKSIKLSTEQKKSVEKQKRKETINLEITQDNDLDNKYYSDFMIDFNEKFDRTYKNVTNLKLKIKSLSDLKPHINETCNKLKIIIGNETKKIELEDGYYELDELLEGITENLEDVNIICRKDKKGRVIFENTNNEEFEIDCEDTSFAKYLGFTENKYELECKYISEIVSPLSINKIFVYFPNISNESFCTIDNNNKINMNYDQDAPIAELDCLIVQIKDSETTEETNFHDFSGNKFNFVLTFDCDLE
jgi:hypothetical protein